ncbi:patatin-like phospholipase family protein [Evansella sp. AB-rgal1]|uniref:patatin-like phospholipase family protein n=1 Tax=Evansella sp. AB-rgal1 TaxID=3242696 RepID=UPI00359CC41F
MLKVDGVFAGGGIKAFSFVGALRIMERENMSFERLAGTSAGSIIAAFITAGFNSEEIEKLFEEFDVSSLLDSSNENFFFRFYRWIRLYRKMGIYEGEILEQWLEEILKQKGVSTFADILPGSLKMVASDLTNGQILILPDDLPKYGLNPNTFSIARAIRMSSSLPFFFEPVKLTNKNTGRESLIVDGGVLSNFPIWLFTDKDMTKIKRPVLGFRLSPSRDTIEPKEVTNAFAMLHSMIDTMRTAHDQRYISKSHSKNIIFIPAQHISTTQFSIKGDQKLELIKLGEESTANFLKKWSY